MKKTRFGKLVSTTLAVALTASLSVPSFAFASGTIDDGVNTPDELREAIAEGGTVEIELAGEEGIIDLGSEPIVITEGMDVTINGESWLIESSVDAFRVMGGKLTLGEGLGVGAGECAIYIRGGEVESSARLQSYSSEYAAIQGNGYYAGDVTINGGSVINEQNVGIYWPQNGTLTVNDGKITGTTGIYAKQGTINLYGGAVRGIGEAVEYDHNNNGCDATGDALVLESCSYGTLAVNITDTGFRSDRTKSIGCYAEEGYDALTAPAMVASAFDDFEYTTIQAAVNAVEKEALDATITVNILEDVQLEEPIVIESGNISFESNEETRNITSSTDAFYVKGGTVYLDSTLNITASDNALYMRGGDTYTSANLTSTSANYAAVQGNGYYEGNLTVDSGTIINEQNVGIYWPQNGTLTINDGEITGTTGIYAKQGTININGGIIVATGEAIEYDHNGNGGDATGDALVLESCSYGTLSASVIGGTFISNNGEPVACYAQEGYDEITAKFIAGGSYSSDSVKSYIDLEKYSLTETEDEDAPWVVEEIANEPSEPEDENTVEIAIEGDDSVKIEATIDESKATISEITSEQIESATEDNKATVINIDLSGLDQDITEVVFSASSIEAIAEALVSKSTAITHLEIELSDATVKFDAKALAAILESTESDNDTISIVIEKAPTKALTSKQQAALNNIDVESNLVIQASILVNDEAVSDFLGGAVTIEAPFTVPSGKKAAHYDVFFVGLDGKIENMKATFAKNSVKWNTGHFSDFVIAYTEPSDYAECLKDAACPLTPFKDVNINAWYHDGLHWAADFGIMTGYTDSKGNSTGILGPLDETTRAQVIVMLHRLAEKTGSDISASASLATFRDAASVGTWAQESMQWAVAEGIIMGYSAGKDAGKLGPNDNITREQLAVMLHRFSEKYMEIDVTVSEANKKLKFPDASSVSSWAKPAMYWACSTGVISGYTDAKGKVTGLGPNDNAERGQIATMLMRFVTNYKIL